MSKIKVRAGDGLVCPVHPTDCPDAGGAVRQISGDDVVEVNDSPNIRRRIRCGDLVVVPEGQTMAARSESVDAVRAARKES